jgi:transposase
MMAENYKNYKIKREMAEQIYRDGKTDIDYIAQVVGVSSRTIHRWINKYDWKTKQQKQLSLEEQILQEADEALLVMLQQYRKNPANADLQSMRNMLKSWLERKRPDKKLNEYIIKFLDQFVDYTIEIGAKDLRKQFQEHVTDFAEYARKRNS